MNEFRDAGESLIGIIREFDLEFHAHKQQPTQVTLDTSFDTGLGLDSLGRMELLYRVEQHFDVSLPDNVIAMIETPRDVLRAIAGADIAGQPLVMPESQSSLQSPVGDLPVEAATLPEVLEWRARHNGERPHVYLLGESGEEEIITYGELLGGSRGIAVGLKEKGLQFGQTVAIMLPTGLDYLYSFYGVLLAGGIPVPIYPPARLSQVEDHLRRHASILDNAQAVILITVPRAKLLARLLRAQVSSLRAVVTPDEISAGGGADTPDEEMPRIKAEDIAFLQYTSGSTGAPKGVVLTHANLLDNIKGIGEAMQIDSTDVGVSWLPLYHDMGLISAWLGSVYFAYPLVLMSPLAFLRRPERWLWAIDKYKGTISAGVNFAYELCLRNINESAIEGLDLSSWRVAGNGAEPVSPDTINRFCERFAPYGFRRETMKPVYGLAECTVALAMPPYGRPPVVDYIHQDTFNRTRRAVEVEDREGAMRVVACGQPIRGHQIRIVDETGRELGEREEGMLQFQGPSATSGYFRNAKATEAMFHGQWLDSGDLAYVAGGDVYLTSRGKDVIIKAGRNIYPHELEEAVGNIPGVRKGCVVAFGSPDPKTGTERLVLMVETRETGPAALEEMRKRINTAAVDLIGSAPDEIALVPPQSVLKTSSGKLRRAASRELYERGAIRRRPRGVWMQILRFAWAGILPQLRQYRRVAGAVAYAAYAMAVFAAAVPLVWSLVAVLPRASWARAVTRLGARMVMGLCRIPIIVRGAENISQGQPVVVATNHASYLDGVILSAALPGRYSYVVMRELTGNWASRLFFRRIGAEFVERFDMQRGIEDARRLGGIARQGRSMVFFPEGGFGRIPGLRSFHMGAFVVAAEAGLPVLPVAMRGARSVLRDVEWFPRRGTIQVQIGEAIMPTGSDWAAAVRLRDVVRREILKHCGEPDLAPPDDQV